MDSGRAKGIVSRGALAVFEKRWNVTGVVTLASEGALDPESASCRFGDDQWSGHASECGCQRDSEVA